MDFGRLACVDHVDFALRADHPANGRVLPGRRAAAPAVRIGTPRWADPGFVGKILPPGTRRADFLRGYAESFDAVELNATWYGYEAETLAGWAAQVPPGFRFLPKLPAAITHERRLRDCAAEVAAFAAALARLGDRLGLAWALLPQDFGPDRLADLERFVAGLPFPLAVELRHPGFFADQPAGRDAFDLLEAHGVAAVITDVAGRRDAAHMRLTTPAAVMVRFAGNGLHPSDLPRIEAWVDRLGTWFDRGLERAYLCLHQPDEHLNVEVAEHLAPRLSARTGLPVARPRRVPVRAQRTLF